MARKNKLRKFAEVLSFPNVFECYDVQRPSLVGVDMEPVDFKGTWQEKYFNNDKPITLELACGGGEYTVGLARLFPERNFIGVDVKGNRLHAGAKDALREGLKNVAFIRTRIEIIDHFFAQDEVEELWITFCDPFPRPTKANKRLTSEYFNDKYRQVLRPGGLVHLKHDDDDLVRYTLGIIAADERCALLDKNLDIYAGELSMPEWAIQTLYEGKHLAAGKTIKYLRYRIS
jgi:tRNA (guanine-N7-)-methyltransferase